MQFREEIVLLDRVVRDRSDSKVPTKWVSSRRSHRWVLVETQFHAERPGEGRGEDEKASIKTSFTIGSTTVDDHTILRFTRRELDFDRQVTLVDRPVVTCLLAC